VTADSFTGFHMRIGIDARLIEETGVGRYIRNLIAQLSREDKENDYIVFLTDASFDTFRLPSPRWKKVRANVHWHTAAEQIRMPQLLSAQKLDLVHIPYHNPPIFYGGRMILTIHDLTILHFSTGKATTLPLPLYALKRLGYWLELWVGLRKASHIIAVSETTKREIMDHFRIPSAKITVTYEGVDAYMKKIPKGTKPLISSPYFLYVGNAYPHKNVETLVSAFGQYIAARPKDTLPKLVLVGNDDFFYRRLKESVRAMNLTDSVVFFGAAKDDELVNLYTYAKALVTPSYMEGFGLPALEALSLGCTVLASDIPIFHEILGDSATYFTASDAAGLARLLGEVQSPSATKILADITQVGSYSWRRMAKETLAIYESSTRV